MTGWSTAWDAPPVPTRRRVAHVMGLPISLALRGRHTDDAAAAIASTVVRMTLL